MRHLPLLLLAVLFAAPAPARADDDLLTRDEVSSFKKKLVAALEGLGAPPAGFAKDKDDFNLPSNFYKTDGKLNPITASATRKLAIKGVQDAQKSQKALGEEYQKKILEAQMKGDYAAMAAISQEMQQKGGASAMSGMQAQQDKKNPIDVRVAFNDVVDEAIDPDNVVVEKPGVIGLKTKNGGDEEVNETVRMFFQPSLKDTKNLSRVRLFTGNNYVPAKTSVATVVIELVGPVKDVEAWAKRVDQKKILALIDAPAK